jgi:hypothetical protein
MGSSSGEAAPDGRENEAEHELEGNILAKESEKSKA